MKTNTSLSTVNSHWKKLLKLVSAVLLGAALLAPHPVAAQEVGFEAIINGAGTYVDDDGVAFRLDVRVTLNPDLTASGHFETTPTGRPGLGGFSAEVTSYSSNPDPLAQGYYVSLVGGPYTVRIYFLGRPNDSRVQSAYRWTMNFNEPVVLDEVLPRSAWILIAYAP